MVEPAALKHRAGRWRQGRAFENLEWVEDRRATHGDVAALTVRTGDAPACAAPVDRGSAAASIVGGLDAITPQRHIRKARTCPLVPVAVSSRTLGGACSRPVAERHHERAHSDAFAEAREAEAEAARLRAL